MKKQIVTLLVGAGVAIAVVVGLMSSGQPKIATHQIATDYPSFDSLAAIDAQSSVVVRGTVTEVGPAYRVVPPEVPVDKLPAYKRAQIGVVQHDVTVRVEKVLSGGRADMAGKLVKVTHLGGQIGSDSYVTDEEPDSQKGKHYVLFLQGFADGRFGMVGGAQGRYIVKSDGRLSALTDAVRAAGVAKQLDGVAADELGANYRARAAQKAQGQPSTAIETLRPSNIPAKP